MAFYQAYNRLCLDIYSFPKPTLAAMTGHAIAGGCILALCCDYRYIAEGRKLMGLNEIKLGVPVPYIAVCILRDLVGGRIAHEVMDSGNIFPADELAQMGLVDKIFPLSHVLSEGIRRIQGMTGSPLGAFKQVKENRIEGVVDQISSVLAAKEQRFVDCWFSPEARELLKKAMNKY
jgi:enoyl-CoA hydratase/carnithine racemase